MRDPEEIAAIIDRYNLADRDSLRELEAYIRQELPIREILFFADFLHGGDFISSSGKWRRNSSGYVTQTHQEDTSLTRLWEGLVRSAHFYIGAASILKMHDARLIAGHAFADEGDGPTLYDYTLDALVRAVPKEYREQLDAASKLDDIKGIVEESKTQVGNLQETANETQTAATATLKIARTIPDAEKRITEAMTTSAERTVRAVGGASVRIQNLKDAIEKKDDDLEGVRQLQRDTLAAVHELKDGKPAQDETTIPNPRDYQVTTTQLAELLTKLGAGRSKRMIEKWEQYLKTDKLKGTRPPDGYKLSTRLTIETATAWAQTFASHETDKLSNKIAFDDRFHQRPK